MNRSRHGASSAMAAKRSSAAGSRSTAISSPSGPRRSATRRAWPPPPKVQSTATSPGCGSRRSISSPASTGTWAEVMSTRMAKAGGELFDVDLGVLGGPGVAVPDLQRGADAGDHDVLLQARVLHEARRHHHAPRGVDLGGERVGGEVALDPPTLGGELVHARERMLDEGVEVLGGLDR